MTVTSGFFNSSNGDRIYDADDFAGFYDGLIFDGVYSSVGNRFNVEALSEMYITVDSGRAWFNHTWTVNDQKLTLEVDTADTVYDRIDDVVLEVNKEQRKNFIKIVKGTPDAYPVRPTLTNTETIIQHALAYIDVRANTAQIEQSDIHFIVDTEETPLASGLNLVGLPSGGKVGQVLAKKSELSGVVGWYNIDHLPTPDWFHPTGITDDDVVAAYKFKGADTIEDALKNVNNSEDDFTLAQSSSEVTWSAANGFFIPAKQGQGLINSGSLQSNQMGTVAVKFSGATTGEKMIGLVVKNTYYQLFLRFNGQCHTSGGNLKKQYNKTILNYNGNFYVSETIPSSIASGILIADFSNEAALMYNGTICAMSTNGWSRSGASLSAPCIFGHTYDTDNSSNNSIMGSCYIEAAVIFNRILTNDEKLSLYRSMDEYI